MLAALPRFGLTDPIEDNPLRRNGSILLVENLLRTVALATALISVSADAMTFGSFPINNNDNSRIIISMAGQINPGDYTKFINKFKSLPEDTVVVGFSLNSPGGNIAEALKITEAIKDQHIGTMVASDSQCASACFLIFSAGEPKIASNRSFIGVHSLTTINVGEDDSAKSSTVDIARYCSTELKIPADIIGKMVATPADSICRLTPAELVEMGVVMTTETNVPTTDPRDLIKQHSPTTSPPLTPPTPPTFTLTPPTTIAPTPTASPMFQRGLADRTAWENWLLKLDGDKRAGAEYWASQRSILHPGAWIGTAAFVAGCNQAKPRLAPCDILRKSEPDYKLGWNSFPENPSFFVQVASRQVYSDAETVRQSVGLFGTVQIVPVVVSGVQWYRVDIGPFASEDEATGIRARVTQLYDDAFITTR